MKTITLTSATYGKHRIKFDEKDHEKIASKKWALKSEGGVGKQKTTLVAYTHVKQGKGKKPKAVFLHRFLNPDSTKVLFKNKNKLDVRGTNLTSI